jgi:hypothetical protein
MNKQEYLIKKGKVADPANGTLWVIKSTRSAVVMYETPVWEIKKNFGEIIDYDEEGNEEKSTTYHRYNLGSVAPYEIDINVDTNTGEEHGYGTGVGDLWGWSYFVTPDKSLAQKLYDDEKLRVQTKYLFF